MQPIGNSEEEAPGVVASASDSEGLRWSGRQDLNLRPLGPERVPEWVRSLVASVTSWQPFESAVTTADASVHSVPTNTPDGIHGSSSPEPFAADLRRTVRVFLRPEALLSVNYVAEFLDVTRQTVHN